MAYSKRKSKKKDMTKKEIERYNLSVSTASLAISAAGLLVAIASLNKKPKRGRYTVTIYED